MGRVKQTARKSTATPSGPGRAQSQAQSQQRELAQDPVRSHMRNLLQTKRKSATPQLPKQSPNVSSTSSSSSPGPSTSRANRSTGRPLLSQSQSQSQSAGKRISNSERVKRPPPKKKVGKQTALILKDIRHIQNGYNNLIPRAPFHRLVRDITQSISPDYRYQAVALEALQEAAESFLIRLFEDAYLCTVHAKRVTLFVQDLILCQRLQNIGNYEAYNRQNTASL